MDEMFVRKTRGEKIKGGEANERKSLERFREQSRRVLNCGRPKARVTYVHELKGPGSVATTLRVVIRVQ